jgi:hypothetical protein
LQQQDAKNNAELQAKWTKATWKTFEKTPGRGQNRPIKAILVMMMMMMMMIVNLRSQLLCTDRNNELM